MSGGSINDSVIVAFERYFNDPPVIAGTAATVQPGMFYRDFEKAVAAQNLLFPSYPASREICALGGLVNNNSGGEKSLRYGKTERYVKRVRYVLRDGNAYDFYPLTEGERLEKMKLPTLEGIHRQLSALIAEHEEVIRKAKPAVSKNSAGYALWNVWNPEAGTFDLTKLFVGAQGTLGLLVEADIALVPPTAHRGMIVIFLYDLLHLAMRIDVILPWSRRVSSPTTTIPSSWPSSIFVNSPPSSARGDSLERLCGSCRSFSWSSPVACRNLSCR